MKLERAIEELTKIIGKWQYSASNERDAALKLLIEAGKRELMHRQRTGSQWICLLPGETKD